MKHPRGRLKKAKAAKARKPQAAKKAAKRSRKPTLGMSLGSRHAKRLFVGVFPTGIVYADRLREKGGDYARVAFLDFATLAFKAEKGAPPTLVARARKHAATLQARRGQEHEVSASGQTVTLGYRLKGLDRNPMMMVVGGVPAAALAGAANPGREYTRTWKSMADVRRANKAAAHNWFEHGAMQFFLTRIESDVIAGRYFVTSEQFEDSTGKRGPRLFSVRIIDDLGRVDTVYDFGQFTTKAAAERAAKTHAKATRTTGANPPKAYPLPMELRARAVAVHNKGRLELAKVLNALADRLEGNPAGDVSARRTLAAALAVKQGKARAADFADPEVARLQGLPERVLAAYVSAVTRSAVASRNGIAEAALAFGVGAAAGAFASSESGRHLTSAAAKRAAKAIEGNPARVTAGELNAHLASGGAVQVTTHLKSTLYRKKHAGMFFERGDSLFVKRGRTSDKLSIGDLLLVNVRVFDSDLKPATLDGNPDARRLKPSDLPIAEITTTTTTRTKRKALEANAPAGCKPIRSRALASNPPRRGGLVAEYTGPVKAAAHVPGFAENVAGGETFHGSPVVRDYVMDFDDGKPGLTERVVFLIGDAHVVDPETGKGLSEVYSVKAKASSKAGRQFIHDGTEGGKEPSKLVADARTGVRSTLGPEIVTNWIGGT